jgi:hypothetical protein
MSTDEVLALLGPPVSRRQEGDEEWYSWEDSYGIRWVCIHVGPNQRVVGEHGN